MTPQETDPDLPVSVQESLAEAWAAGSGTLSVAVCAQDLLKDVAINFTTSTIGLRSNNREGTQFRLSTENWIKVVLSMAPNIRIRSSFPHSQSLPSGSLLSLFFRGQKE